MEQEIYSNIFNYLSKQQLPPNLTQPRTKSFVTKTKQFILKGTLLYKIDKRQTNNFLKVIRKQEMEALLYMMHNDPTAGHFAVDIMFEKIRNRFYWPQMYDDIKAYVRSCDSCQRRGKSKRNEPLHPIPVGEPFYQIGIDIVGPLPCSKKGKRYIVVAIDYLTKWPEAKALSQATAEQVAQFIYEDIICRHGCPMKILSDRGTHFNNKMIQELMQKFEIKHLFSTPYHPQTNGLVERFNRTLCESLAKLGQGSDDWDLFIAPTLFAYRTSKNATTKMEPFYLVYGRIANLPIDSQSQPEELQPINNRLQNLIEDVPQIRIQAQQKIREMQQKQKKRHDQKLKKIVRYNIGEKVLKYRANKEKQWSGKLEPKWLGPYYIHNILINGSYKLRTMEGQVLVTPINGNLLKPYWDRPGNYDN
jgi:hypothetical protein